MHKCTTHRWVRTGAQGLPAFVIGSLHDFSAEPAGGIQLGCWSRIHGEHFAGDARLFCGKRDSLGGVPGADRPYAFPPLLLGEKSNRIVGAANLKRANRLQTLQLQIDFCRCIVVETHQRCADRRFIYMLAGIVDHARRNVSHSGSLVDGFDGHGDSSYVGRGSRIKNLSCKKAFGRTRAELCNQGLCSESRCKMRPCFTRNEISWMAANSCRGFFFSTRKLASYPAFSFPIFLPGKMVFAVVSHHISSSSRFSKTPSDTRYRASGTVSL